MDNAYVKKEMQDAYDRVSERRARQRAKDELQRSVAAVVDFASNLFSMSGNAARRSACLPGQSFNGQDFSIKDFNGEIAREMFRARFTPSKEQGNSKKTKH